MKIFILIDRIPPEGKGGAERVALESARTFIARGHDVSIVTATTREIPSEFEEQLVEGVRVFFIHSKYSERWRAWRSLYNPKPVRIVKKLFQEYKPDVVHIHNVHFDLSYHTLKLAKDAGAKVFITGHDVMLFHYAKLVEFIDPKNPVCKTQWNYCVSAWNQIRRFKWRYNPFRNWAIRQYVRYADTRFAVSNALRDAYDQNGLKDFHVLYTGINANEWEIRPETAQAFREKFNLEGRKVILFGGRITRLKGGDVLVQALGKIVEKVPSALILIAGMRDAYVEELEAKAVALGLSNNIALTGWLAGDELRAAYHASDVIALPSVCFDSFPVTVLEAMACAKPVVATCFGGSAESVEDGVTGYIVNPYDIDSLAAKISDLLRDAKKAEQFGAAGRVRVKEKFSLEQHFATLEEAYTKK